MLGKNEDQREEALYDEIWLQSYFKLIFFTTCEHGIDGQLD